MKNLKLFNIFFVSAIIFSVAFAVLAQTAGHVATPEELAIINSQPEAYVKDIVLEKTDYGAGDTVKGSFTLINGKDIAITNLSYQAFLMGDLMENTLYKYTFDNKILGTLFLDKSETQKVNFEYKLPTSSEAYALGKQLAVEIRSFSGVGAPLGWADAKLNITDSGIPAVSIDKANVVVDGKEFYLNEGPMVHLDKKVSLKLSVSNKTNKDITEATPKISIYEMDYVRQPLGTFSEAQFSLAAGTKQDFNFDLPTFNYTPKVYAGEMVIVDKNGVNRSTPLRFRYIVYGEVVNIRNITLDRNWANKGEEINIKVSYSGTPFDIISFETPPITPSDFSLKLFNEKNQLIAEYSDKTTFDALGEKDVKLTLQKNANAMRAEITVLKNGKVITEYKTSFPEKPKASGNQNLVYLLVGVVLILIIVAVIIFVVKNKKKVIV